MAKLLVGLGNPGAKYAATRHNAGAWWLQAVCHDNNLTLRHQAKFYGEVAEFKMNNEKIICLIPSTYMNESGRSVANMMKFYQLTPEDVLVAHDELDLPAGKLKIKQGGGHAGHNGLRDIISAIGKNFNRVRIGIGHPGDRDQVADYVLKKPSKSEFESIRDVIDASMNHLDNMLSGDWEVAMNALH